ncbi:hypothetical protein F2Q69_00010775 [Brassica cretica]|uniref:Agenet domain-containing protein n=1 Tax=Brassica cretica TaxID=69181 RepID=A0A8S9QTX0_BRACR|nr:hypothetical protein F2Q69_00010775 [Brassica cretica]
MGSTTLLDASRAELGLVVMYLNKAEARDKLCRAIQYGSKFLSDGQPGTAQNVDKSTSLARKVFRLFKFVNDLHGLISSVPKGTPLPLVLLGKEDTHVVHNTPSSPVSSLISRVIEETQHLQTSASSPLSTLFENGADVEIATSDDATCRIWYPGNVFATNRCDGVEKVAVTLFADQKRVTVTTDKIRPKPPADDREKKFEMIDNVEAFYSKGWSSGQVRMILGENTFSVYLNSSMETLEFKASDLRIHREWLDGVWKMADETPLHEANPDQTASRQDEANPDQTQQNEEPRVQIHFDVVANVEIASKYEDRYVKWHPGIVLKTDIRNGVEMLKVEYSTRFRDKEKRTKKLQESVSIHSIRPQPPPGDTKESTWKRGRGRGRGRGLEQNRDLEIGALFTPNLRLLFALGLCSSAPVRYARWSLVSRRPFSYGGLLMRVYRLRWSSVSRALARTASEAQFESPAFRAPLLGICSSLSDKFGGEVSAEWSDGVSVSSAWCLAGGASRRLLSGGFNPDLSGLACSAFFELSCVSSETLVTARVGLLLGGFA